METDLSPLWQRDVANKYLLAAQDTGRKTKFIANSSLAKWSDIAFSEDDQYFNSGVLVMNLSLLRKEKFSSKVIEFLQRWPKQRYPDQDGLNALSIGKWGKLDSSFNSFVGYKRPDFQYKSNSILHYIEDKPWNTTQTKRHDRSEVGKAHRAYCEYMYQSGWFTRAEQLRHRLLCTFFRYFGGPLRKIRGNVYRAFR